MRVPKQLSTIVIAAAVAGVVSFGAGAVVEASATGSSVTYQACLSSRGALSKVGTVTPTCPSASTVISWNSIGPAGPAGLPYDCLAAPYPGVNFVGCNLDYVSGASLTNANMIDANLTAANLSGANLSGANLTDTDFTRTSMQPFYFVPPLVNTLHLINFSNTNLRNANFAGSSLQGANLSGANLSGANLTGSDLSGYVVPLSNSSRFATNLTDAVLQDANLSGANLSSANLRGANLFGANLSSANLSGANLTGASLTGASLSNTTWGYTTCPDGTNSSTYSPQTCVGHGI